MRKDARYGERERERRDSAHAMALTRDDTASGLQQRKNDQASFLKMKQLRKEFEKARLILELVKQRERAKHAYLKVSQEIFNLQCQDARLRVRTPTPPSPAHRLESHHIESLTRSHATRHSARRRITCSRTYPAVARLRHRVPPHPLPRRPRPPRALPPTITLLPTTTNPTSPSEYGKSRHPHERTSLTHSQGERPHDASRRLIECHACVALCTDDPILPRRKMAALRATANAMPAALHGLHARAH